jgi:hypothetical protein
LTAQSVDNFSFAFVTPLGAEDNRSAHNVHQAVTCRGLLIHMSDIHAARCNPQLPAALPAATPASPPASLSTCRQAAAKPRCTHPPPPAHAHPTSTTTRSTRRIIIIIIVIITTAYLYSSTILVPYLYR